MASTVMQAVKHGNTCGVPHASGNKPHLSTHTSNESGNRVVWCPHLEHCSWAQTCPDDVSNALGSIDVVKLNLSSFFLLDLGVYKSVSQAGGV